MVFQLICPINTRLQILSKSAGNKHIRETRKNDVSTSLAGTQEENMEMVLATASGRIEWEANASCNRRSAKLNRHIGILDMLIHSRYCVITNSYYAMGTLTQVLITRS
ncbi:hypothetical protein PN36_28460 [Candidatus Thiomargarita nelsonii]|uniref:Uncharacterized protein n=1 Tax=Candidatus Thiomargarita nelsonii TaxID=1003181 RepID=A0A4E0RNU0_9GAMM|nr:hypothetical protein PN36_28460 [Candidatus Thiomargarita nelsonii]